MHDLDRALADIVAIRTQLARDTPFRGYGPATVAATGGLALLAAAGQAVWLADPVRSPMAYLALWVAIAAIAVALVGVEAVTRSRRLHSGLADAMIYAAIEQFVPAGAAAALLGFVVARFAPDNLWMLPGRSSSASACSRPAARCRARSRSAALGISAPGSPG
jgi:hypothetical protein